MKELFTWGQEIARFAYDFDGKKLLLTKFHPWKSERGRVYTGSPDRSVTQYHCEEMHESFWSVDAALIAWIARKNLGLNQHPLVSGICRALEVKEYISPHGEMRNELEE